MDLPLIALRLAGAVMLLLWAVRMVRTGVERAHGGTLRKALRSAAERRVRAAGSGVGLAVLLQSSTAVAVLAAGFATSGMLAAPSALAILLGADLGSALVVQILSFDLSWLVPILLLAGGTMFLKSESRAVKQSGRILLGIALILLSLRLIGEATAPLRHSELLASAVGYLRGDFVTAFAAAALFTWLIHSSVAAMLLFMALAAQSLLPAEVGIAFVLGANLGSGLIAVWLARGQSVAAQRILIGNLIFRGGGAIAVLLISRSVQFPLSLFGATEVRQLVNLHLAFNLVLLALCLPLTNLMAGLVTKLVPDVSSEGNDTIDLLSRKRSALNRSIMNTPSLALASATREVLRMGEVVEMMLRPVIDMFEFGNREQIKRLRKLDSLVNRMHSDIKLYIAEVNRGAMTADEAQRGIELTDFTINLEHAGDIIAKNLLVLAQEKLDKKLRFSDEGWHELTDLHARVLANMQLAMNVLVSGDLDSARQLVIEKERMRRLERESHDQHLQRLQSGTQQSIETSDIHLETVRSLKEINSLLASVAYPILTQSGDLRESRLVTPVGTA